MKNGLITNEYGTKRYYFNDLLHRADGPAVEGYDGSKWYYINDKLHRIDGPAIEYCNGDKYYFLNGIDYSEENYWKKIEIRKKIQIRRKSLDFILAYYLYDYEK